MLFYLQNLFTLVRQYMYVTHYHAFIIHIYVIGENEKQPLYEFFISSVLKKNPVNDQMK